MSSLKVALSDIGTGGLMRSGLAAVIDMIGGNEKAIVGIIERKDKNPVETYRQVLQDEGLEPFWQTFSSSLLSKIAKVVTPSVPEQLVIIPGKIIGSIWHWLITSHQSMNSEALNGNYNGNKEQRKDADTYEGFYSAFVEGPSNYIFKILGLGDKEDPNAKPSFLRYAISQFGVFGLASYALRDSEENLPGVNISSEEGFGKSLLKGVGYTLVDQITYTASQTMRFYIDFKKEFEKEGNALAKAFANVLNERFFPGRILSGLSSSLATYLLGDYIPKVTAAELGELPLKLLNRLANVHKRRATKYLINKETHEYVLKDENPVKNYRFSDSSSFNSFLNACDSIIQPCRDYSIKLISKLFNVPLKELQDSLTIDLSKKVPAANQPQKTVPIVSVGVA